MLHPTDIGFQIKLIHDGIDRLFRQEMGSEAPTRSQLNVLYYLVDHPGEKVLVKDIMSYLHIDQSTASGIIKRMEKSGHIVCSQDPDDRRQKRISLNPEKQPFPMEFSQQDTNRIEEILLKDISEQDQRELRRILNSIYRNLQERDEKKR